MIAVSNPIQANDHWVGFVLRYVNKKKRTGSDQPPLHNGSAPVAKVGGDGMWNPIEIDNCYRPILMINQVVLISSI